MHHSIIMSFCLVIFCSITQAINITSVQPAKDTGNVCIDSNLRIMFDAAPTVGTGKIEIIDVSTNQTVYTVDLTQHVANQSIGGLDNFNYYQYHLNDKAAKIILPNHTLKPDKKYTVKVSVDAFKDCKGIEWSFTTKASDKAKDASKILVSADGDGDFMTLQGALDSIPDNNQKPVTITLKSSLYHYQEIIYFKNKHNLTITGEDRKGTVIHYANNNTFNKAPQGGYHRGMFYADSCKGLTISNLTFHNTTARGGSQAEAIILKAGLDAQMEILNCDLISFQDTLQISGQCYIADCYIEGDVDFMWGSGPCYFENCHLRGTRSKAYYTQIRNSDKNHGFIYNKCTFDGSEGIERMVFGRIDPNTFPHSEVVLLNCKIGPSVSDWGWLLSKEGPSENIHNWEYNCTDLNGKPLDTSKRAPHTKILKDETDAELIKNYSDPVWVLGGKWNPK